MKSEYTYQNLKVDITQAERIALKPLAKSRGMTLQGFIGQLIKRELALAEKEASDGRR